MHRKILYAAAAIAALSLAACGKPADKVEETTATDTTPMTEGATDTGVMTGASEGGVGGAGEATAPGGSSGGYSNGSGSGSGGGASDGGGRVTGTDAGSSPTVRSGAPVVDTSKGAAVSTTPTGKVPLETERKNNPPPNQ